MNTTTINTIDGPTEVQWWNKEDFQNRTTELISENSYLAIPIPDNLVVCDMCNDKIEEYPVPVVSSYALCKKCFEDIKEGGNNHGN